MWKWPKYVELQFWLIWTPYRIIEYGGCHVFAKLGRVGDILRLTKMWRKLKWSLHFCGRIFAKCPMVNQDVPSFRTYLIFVVWTFNFTNVPSKFFGPIDHVRYGRNSGLQFSTFCRAEEIRPLVLFLRSYTLLTLFYILL